VSISSLPFRERQSHNVFYLLTCMRVVSDTDRRRHVRHCPGTRRVAGCRSTWMCSTRSADSRRQVNNDDSQSVDSGSQIRAPESHDFSSERHLSIFTIEYRDNARHLSVVECYTRCCRSHLRLSSLFSILHLVSNWHTFKHLLHH